MPIKIRDRTFKSFGSAVRFIQDTLGLTKEKALAYVAEVDRKQNVKQEERKTDK